MQAARFVAGVVLGCMGLSMTPPCFGQTSSAQGRDRRLEANETEISLLKRLIKEQDRRIGELEKTIKALQIPASNPEPVTPHEVAKAVLKPTARWHNPIAWSQIREGLSRAQVEEILGKPTTVESVIDAQTLTYKGEVPESGALSGVIKLIDDRVSEIHPPSF